ncbi:MAG: DUF202 domain-containing protein [Melioribacteraceae bacterium]|jgi:putative membrane protein|nr:DUF202 domain-containing protein [Melioribacteraceae bacterium]RJP62983.1 MAG: DUF202 domain-containing protein [Ignavibacteriales bacterium]WKZ69348.1 MAG: DUF202 domain-containing protein [Melioribacteraceae bacterium]
MLRRLNLFKDIFSNKERIILRDYLALERTKLANERTFMAYLRTSLYMILGGIAFLQMEDFKEIIWVSYVTLGLSVVLLFVGLYRYLQIRYRIKNYFVAGYESTNEEVR